MININVEVRLGHKNLINSKHRKNNQKAREHNPRTVGR